MDLTPLIHRGAQMIGAYGTDHVKVSGVLYRHSIFITPDQTRPWDGTLAMILSLCDGVEILLLGTGDEIVPISDDMRAAFRDNGTGIEIMDNGAVARTYNVLLAEGRKVAAAMTLESD